MNILIVAEDWPWPSTGGGLLRLAKMIEAVSEIGDVDLFSLYDQYGDRDLDPLPDDITVRRVERAPYPPAPRQWAWRIAWLRRRGTPLEVVRAGFGTGFRRNFDAWAAAEYDLVWFSTAATYEWLGRPKLGPTIIDLMDLEDIKVLQRSSLLVAGSEDLGRRARFRRSLAVHQGKKNTADWSAFQKSVASEVATVVLCSKADVERSRLDNAVCVPNTYARPEWSVGRLEVSDPPVALLQGSLNYAPNMDAVDWLMDDIAPALWARMPDLRIRLVGRATPGVNRRSSPPACTVVGRVPDIVPELAMADVALVPLRIGSGTRLKILESFAHRIPVISTTVGADGLDVRDGIHLLIADDAKSFAAACQRVLEDASLRKRLVDAAEELYLKSYEWSATKARVQKMALALAAGGADRR